MARKPEQTAAAIHEDRKRLELMFERAEGNTTRSPAQNRDIMRRLSELIRLYRRESIELRGESSPKRTASRPKKKTAKRGAARKRVAVLNGSAEKQA